MRYLIVLLVCLAYAQTCWKNIILVLSEKNVDSIHQCAVVCFQLPSLLSFGLILINGSTGSVHYVLPYAMYKVNLHWMRNFYMNPNHCKNVPLLLKRKPGRKRSYLLLCSIFESDVLKIPNSLRSEGYYAVKYTEDEYTGKCCIEKADSDWLKRRQTDAVLAMVLDRFVRQVASMAAIIKPH